MELKEHQIQSQIMSYLRMKGYYVMRLNSGKYQMGEGKSKRFIQGQESGTPDLLAFKKTTCSHHACEDNLADMLFIEVKRPRRKPTQMQIQKMTELEGYGANCYVIHSLEELEELV